MAAYSSAVHLPSGDWTMLSMGIRMAQDVGAHRKKMYSKRPTPEQEPWKRAWWYALRLFSAESVKPTRHLVVVQDSSGHGSRDEFRSG